MLPLRYPRRWLIAGIVIVGMVAALALAPMHWAARPMSAFSLSDKLLHTLTFAILALWFTGQYAKQSYWKLALALICIWSGDRGCNSTFCRTGTPRCSIWSQTRLVS